MIRVLVRAPGNRGGAGAGEVVNNGAVMLRRRVKKLTRDSPGGGVIVE